MSDYNYQYEYDYLSYDGWIYRGENQSGLSDGVHPTLAGLEAMLRAFEKISGKSRKRHAVWHKDGF